MVTSVTNPGAVSQVDIAALSSLMWDFRACEWISCESVYIRLNNRYHTVFGMYLHPCVRFMLRSEHCLDAEGNHIIDSFSDAAASGDFDPLMFWILN